MENVIIVESGINLHGSNLSDYLGAALGAQVSQMPPRCLAMESRWGGVGWGVSMTSVGSLRGGAFHEYAGGGSGGEGGSPPPPGRSYHRFYTSIYPYIHISKYPNIHISIYPYIHVSHININPYQSISIHINPYQSISIHFHEKDNISD